MRFLPLALVLPLLGGCAARASFQLLNAERAYADALQSGAPKKAAYELTLAGQFLDKAKEEAADAEYQQAETLAKSAIEWSQKAVEVAEARSIELEGNEEVVPEQRVDKPKEEADTTQIDLDDP